MNKALVNKILPFSSVDGPGNRTAIFLQGCNFNCLYCHNPETINRCKDCGQCLSACPVGALSMRGSIVAWDSTSCIGCDACLAACSHKSSPKASFMTVEEMMKVIRKVKPFISGITVSGGECTLQKEFLIELFGEVHKLGLTAFVDTNGSIDFSKEEKLMNSLDMVMLDIKSADEEEHRMLTDMSNSIIIKNVEYLIKLKKLYEIRTVIVPGILDNRRNVLEVSKLISQLDPNIKYKLIKYRPIGVSDDMKKVPIPSDKLMEELQNIAEQIGCNDVKVV